MNVINIIHASIMVPVSTTRGLTCVIVHRAGKENIAKKVTQINDLFLLVFCIIVLNY